MSFKTITVYETRDGQRHDSERSAAEWALRIDDLDAANEMFSNGATLHDAMVRAYQLVPYLTPDDEALAKITKDTKLLISHWQCNDEPSYQVERLLPDGCVRVGGVGGWLGYYGSNVNVADLIRYAQSTFKRRQRKESTE